MIYIKYSNLSNFYKEILSIPVLQSNVFFCTKKAQLDLSKVAFLMTSQLHQQYFVMIAVFCHHICILLLCFGNGFIIVVRLYLRISSLLLSNCTIRIPAR